MGAPVWRRQESSLVSVTILDPWEWEQNETFGRIFREQEVPRALCSPPELKVTDQGAVLSSALYSGCHVCVYYSYGLQQEKIR